MLRYCYQLKTFLRAGNLSTPASFFIEQAYSQPGRIVIAPSYYKTAIMTGLEADNSLWRRARAFDEVVLYRPDADKSYFRNLLAFRWPGWKTQLFLLVSIAHYSDCYFNSGLIVQWS